MSPSSDVSGDNLLTRNTSLANCLDMVRIIQTYSDQDKHKKSKQLRLLTKWNYVNPGLVASHIRPETATSRT